VEADGSRSASRLPAPEHRIEALAHVGQIGQASIQVGPLAQHQPMNVRAWQAAGALDGDDVSDLAQAEAEPLRLPHKGQNVQSVGAVHAVARVCALSRWQDARLLVQPQRLPARTAPLRHFTDQQPVSGHDQTIDPAPEGKVKR
jgi:hypothetical protein